MKKGFKAGLYGILLLVTAVLCVEQASFAGSKVEAVYRSEDGTFGISRIKIATKNASKAKSREEVLSAVAAPAVELYSAFTSDKVPPSYSDEIAPEDIVYYAWVLKNQAHLLGSFTVTGSTSKVKAHWEIDGTEVYSEVIKDPLNTPSENLLKTYWYFAWYKTKAADYSGTAKLRDFKIRVSIWDGSSEVSGTEKEETCKFRAY
ncbi:MAG TPA: hypothetical protein ACFYEK_08440 [Candidatus Wunengus sp. YC60]|uniref:hypothetical protein n=1 Tax=Candidatus Wunengus sp. YC60 TaxID=3367697 RepID=UPI0040273A90